jgi:hypothetical protein
MAARFIRITSELSEFLQAEARPLGRARISTMNKTKPLLTRGLLLGSEPLTRELCQRVQC